MPFSHLSIANHQLTSPGRPLPPPIPLSSLPTNRPPTPPLNLPTRDTPHHPPILLPPPLLAALTPGSRPSNPLRLPPNRLPRAPPLALPPAPPTLLLCGTNPLPHDPPADLHRGPRALQRREIRRHPARRRVDILRQDNRRPLRIPVHVLLQPIRLRNRTTRSRVWRPIPSPDNHRHPVFNPAPTMPNRIPARAKP